MWKKDDRFTRKSPDPQNVLFRLPAQVRLEKGASMT